MTITENLTGVVKENHERVKTVTDILEEVSSEICNNYCKYQNEMMYSDEMLETKCSECPLNRWS